MLSFLSTMCLAMTVTRSSSDDSSSTRYERHLAATHAPSSQTWDKPAEAPVVPPMDKPAFSPVDDKITEAYFVYEYCLYYLLRSKTTDDGLISASEYAAMIYNYCYDQGTCSQEVVWESLSSELKNAFANPLCPAGVICEISNPDAFGYAFTSATVSTVTTQITDLCNTIFPLLGGLTPPTPAPNGNTIVPSFSEPPSLAAPVVTTTKAPVHFTEAPSAFEKPAMAPVSGQAPSLSVAPVSVDLPSLSDSPSAPGFTISEEPTVMPSSEVSSSPSSLPSIKPSDEAASVFINEIGQYNGLDFVEIAYNSYLGSGINMYRVTFYDSNGEALESSPLRQGNFSEMGLSLTYVMATSNNTSAVALVSQTGNVTYFLSYDLVVLALDGPARGMNSTVSLSGTNTTSSTSRDVSHALSGPGCEFQEFTFEEVISTPGEMNVGQTVSNCKGYDPPTLAPSMLMSGGSEGITTGAIVGIAVSGGLLCLITVYLGCGHRADAD